MCEKLSLEQRSLAKLFYSLGLSSFSSESSFEQVKEYVVSLMLDNPGLMRKYIKLGNSGKFRRLANEISLPSLFPEYSHDS